MNQNTTIIILIIIIIFVILLILQSNNIRNRESSSNFLKSNRLFARGSYYVRNNDDTNVIPILECVEKLEENLFKAHWGYKSDRQSSVNIPIGGNNKFSPSPQDRGQPVDFNPGTHNNVFTTIWDGFVPLIWYIKAPDGSIKSAQARENSPTCGEESGCHHRDCNGVCNGTAVRDCNGECDGPAILDCAGVCGGLAVRDCSNVCNGDAVRDCAGVCNGHAVPDCNGVCNGDAVPDCDGVCDGNAFPDCKGKCNGDKFRDCEGVCGGNATFDCAGVCNGNSFYDCDGHCVTPDDCGPIIPPPTGQGCTLSQGFWKTHGPVGCNPGGGSNVWPVVSLSLGSVIYNDNELCQILNQPVGGNGLILLAHQLIAAKLNIANGANPAPIAATVTAADVLIGGLIVPPIGGGFLAPGTVSALATSLDQYNNGNLGVPHCP